MDLYNVSALVNSDTTQSKGVIDNITFRYLSLIIAVIVNPVLSIVAFFAAIANVVTFSGMNLKQGVNQNLLVLSAADLFISVVGLVGNTCYVMIWAGVRSMSVLYTLAIVLWTITLLINTSTVVTTVIAVVRCLSVVMPLTFRTVVTHRRQMLAIALGCIISWSVSLYTNISLYLVNGGDLPLVSSDEINRHDRMTVFDTFRNSFFYTCLAIAIASGVFLSISLRKSSKFQTKSSSSSDVNSKSASRREVQVAKTIVLLLVIFVACNLPLLALSVMRLLLQGFSSTGRYRNARLLTEYLSTSGVLLNVSLNSLVYIKYNSQFRARLASILASVRFGNK